MVVRGHEAQVCVVIISVYQNNREIVVVDALYKRAVRAARDCDDSVDSSGKKKGGAVVEIFRILHSIYHYGYVVAAVYF